MRKQVITLAILSALGAAALAAPVTYTIDPTHTMPRFEYSHFGYSTQLSRFDKVSGKIVLDREAKTGTVDIEMTPSRSTPAIPCSQAIFKTRTSSTPRSTPPSPSSPTV